VITGSDGRYPADSGYRYLRGTSSKTKRFTEKRGRVAAGRARVRTAARIIIGVTLLLVVALLVWSKSFLSPYGTPAGQLMLLVIGGCFAAGFWWLQKISAPDSDPRILVNLPGTPAAGQNGARP
jgi:hypothetical protein